MDRFLLDIINDLLPVEEEDELRITKVLFNEYEKNGVKSLATVVLWNDGTKTITKCSPEDEPNRELGAMLCVCKKALSSNLYHDYCEMIESDNPVERVKNYIICDINVLEGVTQNQVNDFILALGEENRGLLTARLIAQYFVPKDYHYLKRESRRKPATAEK